MAFDSTVIVRCHRLGRRGCAEIDWPGTMCPFFQTDDQALRPPVFIVLELSFPLMEAV